MNLLIIVAIVAVTNILAFLAGAYVYREASRESMKAVIDFIPIPEMREQEQAITELTEEQDYDWFNRTEGQEERPA